MVAVDTQTSVLKEFSDANDSQHGEEKGRTLWKSMRSYESERVKSELMESSTKSGTRGKMPDDPTGNFGDSAELSCIRLDSRQTWIRYP